MLLAGVVSAVMIPRMLRSNSESLGAAMAAGKIRIVIEDWNLGNLRIRVAKTTAAGPDLTLDVPLGTTFFSLDSEFQSIVVTGVRGKLGEVQQPQMGQTIAARVPMVLHDPTSTIVAGNDQETYFLDGYCANFHRHPPTEQTPFRIQGPDPALACILQKAAKLSWPVGITQAAVWIQTDNITYETGGSRIVNAEQFVRAAEAASQCASSR
jgi:hypothetical protein